MKIELRLRALELAVAVCNDASTVTRVAEEFVTFLEGNDTGFDGNFGPDHDAKVAAIAESASRPDEESA